MTIDESVFLVIRDIMLRREFSNVHNHGMRVVYSWTLRRWNLDWTWLIILYPVLDICCAMAIIMSLLHFFHY